MNAPRSSAPAAPAPVFRAPSTPDATRSLLWPSRRQLLRTSLAGALALWGGSAASALLPARAAAAGEAAGLAFFRAKDLPMARAVILAFLDWTLPSDPAARREAVQQAIATADRYFSSFAPAVQAEAQQAFDLLGLAPVRWLGGLFSGWDSAPAASVNRYLESMRTGWLGLSRQIFLLLEGVAVVGWYGQAASWKSIGYPGPPQPARPSGEKPL